ncbi:Flagellar export FliJ [Salinibacter ruber M8]|nr:Flagellar export FliJ [Salinibacter ruber M8]
MYGTQAEGLAPELAPAGYRPVRMPPETDRPSPGGCTPPRPPSHCVLSLHSSLKMPGKKFRFSLQKVLELRQHETEKARQALADAERALEQKEDALEQAEGHLAECRRRVDEARRQDPARIQQADAFRQAARQTVEETRDAVEACRERVEQARAELRERRRAEEALEELRSQERDQHDREQKKASEAFFDEQATLRHDRTDEALSLL